MKAFTKTVTIACCLIPEAVALRVSSLHNNPESETQADEVKDQLQPLEEDAAANDKCRSFLEVMSHLQVMSQILRKMKGDVSLDIPKWMHFETQTDKFSCQRHTLNNLLNLLVPEESRDWEGVAFPTHEDLVAFVGKHKYIRESRHQSIPYWNIAWLDREMAPVLFEKSKHQFGLVYVAESGIPLPEPKDGRCYKRGNKNHATFIYYQSETDGQCLPGWKKVCSGLGMTHFNNWEECRQELLDDVSQTMQVVSRGHSCFKDRFGRPVPICSVPLPIDDFQGSELYVEASTADQLFDLGDVYLYGWGVSKDSVKAFAAYKRAAEKGHVRAHRRLGFMYAIGEGVQEDLGLAAKWFRLAAELGDSRAQWMLGQFYENGWEGVDKDLAEALKLYQQAADQGNKNAQELIEQIPAQDMFKLAETGNKDAQKIIEKIPAQDMFELAQTYWFGQGVSQDYKKAFNLYKRAADRGHARAHEHLGWMFMSGDGADFPSNLGMAEAWFRRAAELGCENAAHKLLEFAEMYKSGTEEVSQDYEQAFDLYKLAAAQGNASVREYAAHKLCELAHELFELADMYTYGTKEVSKDNKKAFDLYKLAAAQGSASVQGAANCRLGAFYQKGLGVKKNMDQALEFYEKAANQDDCPMATSFAKKQIEKMKSKRAFWKNFGL